MEVILEIFPIHQFQMHFYHRYVYFHKNGPNVQHKYLRTNYNFHFEVVTNFFEVSTQPEYWPQIYALFLKGI